MSEWVETEIRIHKPNKVSLRRSVEELFDGRDYFLSKNNKDGSYRFTLRSGTVTDILTLRQALRPAAFTIEITHLLLH